MKFVANRINKVFLRELLPELSHDVQVDGVKAAIAYGSSTNHEVSDLVGHSVANKLRLDLWMRYDHTVPVTVPLLKRLLRHQKDNVFTNFIPDCFHPKVIWWQGYGAYIGSANHSDRGWLTNIEAGIFIDEDDLIAQGISTQLDKFFEYLDALDKSIPLSESYIREMEEYTELNKGAFSSSKKKRKEPEWEGPVFVSKEKAYDRQLERFQKEWLRTLSTLKDIEKQILVYRPSWIDDSVPAAWQVDQFLHAYYYTRVGDGLLKPYEEEYQKHQADPQAELAKQLSWWKNNTSAPMSEDKMLYVDAPVIRQLLSKERVLTLTVDDIAALFEKTHATKDHIIKVPMKALGKPELKSMSREERIPLFAKLMVNQVNRKGWDIRKLLHYVLWEGNDDQLMERLFHAGRDPEFILPRYGLNSIAEVTGWARPEIAPPRNGRTSKALRALGYPVKIY